MKDWEKENLIQKETLDKYDFEPFLKKYNYVEDLMEAMEEECDVTNLPEEMNGFIFNFWGPYEVMIYLTNRYSKWHFQETINYAIIGG